LFNRYPDQAASRKGFALVGTLVLVFGVLMALFEAAFLAGTAICLGLVLVVTAFFCDHSAFAAVERVLSRVFAGW
jgi:hypothetical protein